MLNLLGHTKYVITFELFGHVCLRNLQIISLRRMPQQMFPVLQYELEEKKRSEGQQNVPEFVRVRGTLKRIQTFPS